MANDIDDVMRQMREAGIEPPTGLDRAFKGYYRWKPSGEKKNKKSAWARLYEYKSQKSGRTYITGAFGIRQEVYDIRPSDQDWTPAERAAAMEERKAAQKAAELEREKDAEEAGAKALKLWAKAREGSEGPLHPYLVKKKVGAYGVRVGFGNTLYIPLRDLEDKLHGLQYIAEDCASKKFGTGVIKEGRFHLIGEIKKDVPIAFGEGYATCASGYMATEWPTVVCWDAGNLDAVIGSWRKLYPDHQFVILADDDRHLIKRLQDRLMSAYKVAAPMDELAELGEHEWDLPDDMVVTLKAGWAKDSCGVSRIEGHISATGKPTQMLKLENAGRAKAMAAAKRHKATVLFPRFQDDADPGTDWNDLHCQIGLQATREQLLEAFKNGGEVSKNRASKPPQGGGKKEPKQELQDLSFLDRYTLIYGTCTVWDAKEREIIRLEAVKAAYGKNVDWWLGSSERKMVSQSHVVFDPTGKIAKPDTHVNLFDGLESQPKKGECDLIVKHLMNLCGEDDRLFHWVASWLALPLKRLGTKMRTSLIIHGRQEGTGKSLMMDVMRKIYGRYSRSITQVQLQSEFNGWQSGMLFCVAEEVVSASERKNLKNLIQNMITNTVVQINEKNMPVREEASYANFAFLSNEQIPMLLNETDRRYTVIQVEARQDPDYFAAIGEQMENGGIEAFHQYLLDYELEGFNEFTLPFETKARMHLITLGMGPDQRFYRYWSTGLADVPFCTCTARDLYQAFRSWCRINGERFICNNTQFGRTISEALDRAGAPPKKSVRYDAYSATQVDKGDFGTDINPSAQQGVVYFVPASIQKVTVNGKEPSEEAKAEEKAEECTDRPVYEKRIKHFQYRLHSLIDQARRSF
jgi:putative DNA primase/helicase